MVNVELATYSTALASVWESGKTTTTDAGGRFALTNVPRALVRIAVHGDELMEQRFEVDALDLGVELRLVVDLRCHFRVSCERSPVPARTGKVLDERGEELQLFEFQNGGWSSSSTLGIRDQGSSHTVAVSERARTLVLYAGDEELARVPLVLVPGEINEVRY